MVATHAPLYSNPRLSGKQEIDDDNLQNTGEIEALFTDFTNVHFLSGHTHVNYNVQKETTSVNTILQPSVPHGGGRVNCLAIIPAPMELLAVMAYICGTAIRQNGIIKAADSTKATSSEPTISTPPISLLKYMLLNTRRI